MGIGDWGLGDWGLGIGPNPQSPIPNIFSYYFYQLIFFIIPKFIIWQIKNLFSKNVFRT